MPEDLLLLTGLKDALVVVSLKADTAHRGPERSSSLHQIFNRRT
jgi:hypothetical protein